MANIDIELDEANLVEKDGILYRKQSDGSLVQTGWDHFILGFKNTDIYRAENIVSLRKDKYFNDSGINVDSVINTFFRGAAGKMLDNLIVEEFNRLQVDIQSILAEDKDFIRNTIITITK